MENLTQNAIPATIQKVQTMVRHARIVVDTQENLTADQLSKLFALHEKPGWFFFLPAPDGKIKTDDLPEIKLEDGEKSPGQRLRASLYVWWEQKGKPDDFELFYRRHMERIIEQVKEKLT